MTPISAIFMAISGETIMANITKMAIMAIMGLPYIVTNMADIGVLSKNSKNADPRTKRFIKFNFSLKVTVETIYGLNLWPFPLYFWLENGHSKAGTSHGTSELILCFWTSGEQDKWD